MQVLSATSCAVGHATQHAAQHKRAVRNIITHAAPLTLGKYPHTLAVHRLEPALTAVERRGSAPMAQTSMAGP